jgi:Xaa-Pro aminopeptidase
MPDLTRRLLRGPILAAACCAVLALYAAQALPPALLLGQTPQEFADRRTSLRKAAGDAVVLLVSAPKTTDRARFRADNDLVYLTGLEPTHATLAILPDGDPLGQPSVLFMSRGWRGSSALEDAKSRTGVESVLDQRDMWETLRPSLTRASTVYIMGPVGERARHTPSGEVEQRLRGINATVDVRDAGRLIAPFRVRKSAGEISNLRAAIAATIRGFRRGAPTIRPGVTELALEGALIAGFREGGAAREGFPCVIGAGPNAIVLHNDPTDRRMLKGETVVADIGTEVNYYTADLTRTFPVGGKFTPRAREIYELVRGAQIACEKAFEPGKTTWSALNSTAREHFRQSPLRAADGGGEMRTMDRFFTHGVGHWLGMDVHDVGSMSGPIMPGSVITIEPGLYIASENIGVRIEDDFLVTDTGVERLSADLPTEAAAIERMVRGR